MSDFRLVLAPSVAPFRGAPRASLAERAGRVEEGAAALVVHPVFFGWVDLAEEEEKELREQK